MTIQNTIESYIKKGFLKIYQIEIPSVEFQATRKEFKGDIITPRFFSGITQLDNQSLLLFGGQGNKTGEQSVGKTYYYDCYKVNLNTKKIIKL